MFSSRSSVPLLIVFSTSGQISERLSRIQLHVYTVWLFCNHTSLILFSSFFCYRILYYYYQLPFRPGWLPSILGRDFFFGMLKWQTKNRMSIMITVNRSCLVGRALFSVHISMIIVPRNNNVLVYSARAIDINMLQLMYMYFISKWIPARKEGRYKLEFTVTSDGEPRINLTYIKLCSTNSHFSTNGYQSGPTTP